MEVLRKENIQSCSDKLMCFGRPVQGKSNKSVQGTDAVRRQLDQLVWNQFFQLTDPRRTIG